jgi:hypothetical protein
VARCTEGISIDHLKNSPPEAGLQGEYFVGKRRWKAFSLGFGLVLSASRLSMAVPEFQHYA